MDPSYFDEIYELCGPDMKEAISNIIKNDQPINRVNHARVIDYLYTLSDDEFHEVYINMPIDHNGFVQDDTSKTFNNAIYMTVHGEIHDEIHNYSYVDIVYAIISRSDLIRKCLAISSASLIDGVKILTLINQRYGGRYNDLNLESCKLLHEYGCSLSNLFLIANKVLNYESMSYIITHLTESDYIDIFNDSEHKEYNIYYILILNKLKHNAIILLFYNRIMKYIQQNDTQIVVQCFYIIKFIPKLDALIFLTDNLTLSDPTHAIYKKLLMYHLKPRGSHTKAAITF
jgi:hypothetical protein